MPAHNTTTDAMDTHDGCASSKTKLKYVFVIKTIQHFTFTQICLTQGQDRHLPSGPYLGALKFLIVLGKTVF